MSKLYRTSRAPDGALMELRNRRLYGDRDTQIETASLRSRGTPNPDRAYVPAAPRKQLRQARETRTHLETVQAAQVRMLKAQRDVRHAKQFGFDYSELARESRDARAAYLKLTDGVERRIVDAPIAEMR